MKKDAIRTLVKERIELGYTRQMVLDELVAIHPEVKPKRIADVVRYQATLLAREQYRDQQRGLLVAVLLYGALELFRPMITGEFRGGGVAQWFQVLPCATLFLGYQVHRWRGEGFQWLAIVNFLSALGLLGLPEKIREGGFPVWATIGDLLSLVIAALAWHLAHRMFSAPKVEKDPAGSLPPRYVFPAEHSAALL